MDSGHTIAEHPCRLGLPSEPFVRSRLLCSSGDMATGSMAGTRSLMTGRPDGRRALRNAATKVCYEAKVARAEGRFPLWPAVVVDAIHDPSGTLIGFAEIKRDIRERLQAQVDVLRKPYQVKDRLGLRAARIAPKAGRARKQANAQPERCGPCVSSAFHDGHKELIRADRRRHKCAHPVG
jgi:hypothetical protein